MSVIHSFFQFLRSPQFQDHTQFSPKVFFQSYAWAMFFAFMGMIIIGILTFFFSDDISNINSEVAEQALEEGSVDLLWSIVFAAVVMAPILEELLFRLPLTAKLWMWQVWLVVSPVITSYIFFTVSIFTEEFWQQAQDMVTFQDFHVVTMTQLIVLVGGGGLLIGTFWFSQETWKKIISFITPGITYILALGFGLVHLVNFSDLPFLLYGLGVFLVFPQIMAGFIMSYIRVKQGLISVILFHAVYNGILLIPVIMSFWLMEGGDSTPVENEFALFIFFPVMSVYGVGILSLLGWSLRDAWRYKQRKRIDISM